MKLHKNYKNLRQYLKRKSRNSHVNSLMKRAWFKAHHAKLPALRSAFRGIERAIAGTFSGAVLSKIWIDKLLGALKRRKIQSSVELSGIFALVAKNFAPQYVLVRQPT